MLPKVEKAKQIRASMALEAQNIVSETSLLEDYGDTVPSKPQDVDAVPSKAALVQHAASHGIGSTVEGDFGTVVVRDEAEMGKMVIHDSVATAKDSLPAPAHLRSLSVKRVGDKQIESRYFSKVPRKIKFLA